MHVTLINDATWQGDLQVDNVTWTSPPARTFGSASLFVPWLHEALDDRYLDPEGGSRIEINGGPLGRWVGLTQKPAVTEKGLTIEAMEIAWLVSNRVVGWRTLQPELTAGAIARQAVSDALSPLGWVVLGEFVEGGVTFPTFEFQGEYLADILGRLQERTGEEWQIRYDGQAFVFDWRPPGRSYYIRHLSDGGDLSEVSAETAVDDRVAEVIAIGSDGRMARRTAPEVQRRLWAKQKVIQVDTTSDIVLGARAEQELTAGRYPSRTYKAKLVAGPAGVLSSGYSSAVPRGLGAEPDTTAHWSSLREGDLVYLHTPRAGVPTSTAADETAVPRGLGMEPVQRKSGATPLCRLVSRTWGDNRRFLEVEFQWVRPWDAGTVALAKNRVLPAVPVALNTTAGRLIRGGAAAIR